MPPPARASPPAHASPSYAPECPPEAVRDDGWVGVVGIGSLLSERSARHTSPNLRGFKTVRLRGYRRVFAHTAPVFFERGIADGKTREVSSLSMEALEPGDDPREAHGPRGLVATYFEIPGEEFPALAAREAEFELRAVTYEDDGDDGEGGCSSDGKKAILCVRSSDAAYVERHCERMKGTGGGGGAEGAEGAECGCVACVLRGFGEERIWYPGRRSPPAVYPTRAYARHCVLAAKSLGPEALASFLDHTFLADRRTTLRTHLERNPSLMETPPPPELAERYGG